MEFSYYENLELSDECIEADRALLSIERCEPVHSGDS